jgi:hypothetical protein
MVNFTYAFASFGMILPLLILSYNPHILDAYQDLPPVDERRPLVKAFDEYIEYQTGVPRDQWDQVLYQKFTQFVDRISKCPFTWTKIVFWYAIVPWIVLNVLACLVQISWLLIKVFVAAIISFIITFPDDPRMLNGTEEERNVLRQQWRQAAVALWKQAIETMMNDIASK